MKFPNFVFGKFAHAESEFTKKCFSDFCFFIKCEKSVRQFQINRKKVTGEFAEQVFTLLLKNKNQTNILDKFTFSMSKFAECKI